MLNCFTSPHDVRWMPRDAAHTEVCHGYRRCTCTHGLGAAWDLLGRGYLPTSTGLTPLQHSSPSLSGGEWESTSTSVCCCQQHGLLPFWFCFKKACLFCRGLLEKHQNINTLIYLLISSPQNLCVVPELDTMSTFLYNAKPRQVRLGLEHKYTNASSICLWIPELCKNMSHGYSTDLHLREKEFRQMYRRQYICL